MIHPPTENDMYMPTLARFTSRDPLADTEEPVMGGISPAVQAAIIQQYAYANNSPMNFMDPSGLCCEPHSYCGPDVDGVLVAEIEYAIRFFSQHVRKYTSSLLRFAWYRATVRWQHMLKIGPQLDWTKPTSSLFREGGVLMSCPTDKCKETNRICGRCVHDHFIGNLMFGLWIKLHGFPQTTGFLAGEGAQRVGETAERGADKSWDRAGYVLGFRVYNAIVKGDENLTEGTLCAILKGDGGGDAWYDMANETGRDMSQCLPCPAGLDGGVKNWTKEAQNPYPAF